MDDEDDIAIALETPQRHNAWSFIVLGVDLLHSISADITDALSAATVVVSQHRHHKIEEDKFHEITRGM